MRNLKLGVLDVAYSIQYRAPSSEPYMLAIQTLLRKLPFINVRLCPAFGIWKLEYLNILEQQKIVLDR